MAAAAAEPTTKTLKIGTRGSPLAMAQAYLTKQLLQVGNMHKTVAYAKPHDEQRLHLLVLSVPIQLLSASLCLPHYTQCRI